MTYVLEKNNSKSWRFVGRTWLGIFFNFAFWFVASTSFLCHTKMAFASGKCYCGPSCHLGLEMALHLEGFLMQVGCHHWHLKFEMLGIYQCCWNIGPYKSLWGFLEETPEEVCLLSLVLWSQGTTPCLSFLKDFAVPSNCVQLLEFIVLVLEVIVSHHNC